MPFKLFIITILLCSTLTQAQSTIKTMFYNLLEFPEAHPNNRAEILKDIVNEFEPDLFMICELQNQEGANAILNTSLNDNNTNYSAAPYFDNQSSNADLQQLLYYRHDKFILQNTEILTTPVRDINKYTLLLSTADQDTDPLKIHVYVSHLKSSQGSNNQQLRLQMVNRFFDDTSTLPQDSFVLFAGDFNIYRSTEPAYIKLLNPTNQIVMTDPIDTPGSWNNNINFAPIHTQSTRISSGPFGAGAGGGLDDRFDFILTSQNINTDPSLRYIPNTYNAFGNNGNCFNQNINNTDCTGVYSQELRENLYNMSDHLPVVMNLETDKEIVILGSQEHVKSQPVFLKSTIVSETLTILIPQESLVPLSFNIYNTLGQVIDSFIAITTNYTQNISHLANGVYYLTNQSSNRTIKFVKTF